MTDVTVQIIHNSSTQLFYFIKFYTSYCDFLNTILA